MHLNIAYIKYLRYSMQKYFNLSHHLLILDILLKNLNMLYSLYDHKMYNLIHMLKYSIL
jgi:hypothetical protein